MMTYCEVGWPSRKGAGRFARYVPGGTRQARSTLALPLMRSHDPFGLDGADVVPRQRIDRLFPGRELKETCRRDRFEFGLVHVAGDDDEEGRGWRALPSKRTRRREHRADAFNQQRWPAFHHAHQTLDPEQPLAEGAGKVVEPSREIGKRHLTGLLREADSDTRMRTSGIGA